MRILLPEKVYREFLSFAIKFAHPSRTNSTWREVAGIIIGKYVNEELLISEISYKGSGTSVLVKLTDYSLYAAEIASILERGEAIWGWAHTHPGFGCWMSGTDFQTHLSYHRQNPLSVAIVLDPSKPSISLESFNAFQLDKDEKTFLQIPIVIIEDDKGRELSPVDIQRIYECTIEEVIPILLSDLKEEISIEGLGSTELVKEIVVEEIKEVVSLDDLKITISVPETPPMGSPFALKFFLEQEGNKELTISYNLEIKAGKAQYYFDSSNVVHRLLESGNFAIYRIIPDNNTSKVEVLLTDICIKCNRTDTTIEINNFSYRVNLF